MLENSTFDCPTAPACNLFEVEAGPRYVCDNGYSVDGQKYCVDGDEEWKNGCSPACDGDVPEEYASGSTPYFVPEKG